MNNILELPLDKSTEFYWKGGRYSCVIKSEQPILVSEISLVCDMVKYDVMEYMCKKTETIGCRKKDLETTPPLS